ncbi:MAG: ATP-binding protein [Gemmatimonadetes bacterium]|nr:MAG: ATP-binding protein [Gemmatimonadota bacterium]
MPSTPRPTSAVPGRASRTAWSCSPGCCIRRRSPAYRSRAGPARWEADVSRPQDVLVAWSGGKDSALALREIVHDGRYRVAALLTTVTREYDRISMHGVRRTLLERQAASLGLPLEQVVISPGATNDEYEGKMASTLEALRDRMPGLDTVVFGDLFLADIRAYRERMLARTGMRALFPLWLRDTRALAHEFVRLGYRAVLVCVDADQLTPEFAGREFDADLLRDIPSTVDPCGENGEFHTFVYAGPGFRHAVRHARGPVVVRDRRFVYCDLVETDAR